MEHAEFETVEHTLVSHVGDLDAERTPPHNSYEGDGLSVSTCPEAWARILRIGGTCYELFNPTGEFYSVDPTDTPRPHEREWCLSHDYIRDVPGYRTVWEDENGVTTHIEFRDRERAVREAHERPAGRVEPVTSVELDDAGRDYWQSAFTQDPDTASPTVIRGLLPVWYAEGTTDLDGVWWHERYDPANLSAPRGVIFQSTLDRWKRHHESPI